MKGEVEDAKDLQRIDPGFHFSTLVAEHTGAHSDHGEKFPGADGAGKFERWRRLLGGDRQSRDKEKAQQNHASKGKKKRRRRDRAGHFLKFAQVRWRFHFKRRLLNGGRRRQLAKCSATNYKNSGAQSSTS